MRTFIISAIAAALLLSTLAACSQDHAPAPQAPRPQVQGVTVTKVALSEIADTMEASGTVKAATTSIVASRVMGAVVALHVREGDYVAKGQVLAEIDDRDLRQRVRAAEEALDEAHRAGRAAQAQKALADKTFERYQSLITDGAISQYEMDKATMNRTVAAEELARIEAMARRAQAGLDEARLYLDYAQVRAPISGIVSERRTDLGSMAAPGMPLLVIEQSGEYLFEAAVDEAMLPEITRNQEVQVEIPALGRSIKATLTQIVPSVNQSTRTFIVKARLSDPEISGGYYGVLRVGKSKRQALTVPASAMVARGQLEGVYVVDNAGVIAFRMVRTAHAGAGTVEIISGLRPGEQVITEGTEKAMDGGVVSAEAGR